MIIIFLSVFKGVAELIKIFIFEFLILLEFLSTFTSGALAIFNSQLCI